MPEATQHRGLYRFGAFDIDIQSGELRKNGTRMKLSGQSFQVLALLIERAGEVVTRDELHAKLWQADTFVDFDHGLNNAVARIRDVLNDSSERPRYVETVPRRGYRFIAPVTGAQPPTISLPPTEAAHQPGKRRIAGIHALILLAAAVALAVLVVSFMLYRGRLSRTKQLAIKSLAVLPLKNLSDDPGQEYLADGMTEELIGRLAGLHDIRVISRTSVMRFKDTKLSVPEIANTLGVDALLEGSVIRQGDRIRVHAHLIRAATEQHFWSESYDRRIEDVLALQSEVAQSITERIAVTVTGQERSRLVAARHVSPEAYESYLKGKAGKRDNRAELEESVTYFEDAIKKDPTFAPAYVGLAGAYDYLGTVFVGGSPAAMRPKVISAVRKALELDPESAEAHVILGAVFQKQWRWKYAKAEYQRALQLKPNAAAAHLGFADWLLCQGRIEEALGSAERARELDPLGTAGNDIGWILFQARRYDEAIRELRSVLAVHPDSAWAHWDLGFALIGKGQPQQAIPELERTISLMHRSPGSLELLATAYGHVGRRAEALELINELKLRRQTSYVPPGVFVNPYLALREYDEAFAWLERAYSEQSNLLQFLKVHPFFDPIRGDPRFQDLVRRVGLQ